MKGPLTQAASLLLCGSLLSSPMLQAAEQSAAALPAPQTAPDDANDESVLPTLAATNQQLSQLVQHQDYQSAYQLAQPLLSLYEGDPAFDFYYAFSAASLVTLTRHCSASNGLAATTLLLPATVWS